MKIRIYKADLLLSVLSLILVQQAIDIPGMDVPDIKDIPGMNWHLSEYR